MKPRSALALLALLLLTAAGCGSTPSPTFSEITGLTSDPRWKPFEPYLKELAQKIEKEWHGVFLANGARYPSGSTATLTFMLRADGSVGRIVSSRGSSKLIVGICTDALKRGVYAKWTPDMVAALNAEEPLTFTFQFP